MLGCQAIVLPRTEEIVPNCLCGIGSRQLELLLWRTRTDSPTSSSMFASNGLTEQEEVEFPMVCQLVAKGI